MKALRIGVAVIGLTGYAAVRLATYPLRLVARQLQPKSRDLVQREAAGAGDDPDVPEVMKSPFVQLMLNIAGPALEPMLKRHFMDQIMDAQREAQKFENAVMLIQEQLQDPAGEVWARFPGGLVCGDIDEETGVHRYLTPQAEEVIEVRIEVMHPESGKAVGECKVTITERGLPEARLELDDGGADIFLDMSGVVEPQEQAEGRAKEAEYIELQDFEVRQKKD